MPRFTRPAKIEEDVYYPKKENPWDYVAGAKNWDDVREHKFPYSHMECRKCGYTERGRRNIAFEQRNKHCFLCWQEVAPDEVRCPNCNKVQTDNSICTACKKKVRLEKRLSKQQEKENAKSKKSKGKPRQRKQ